VTNRYGSKAVHVVRWIARISSGFIAALILLIFIGEGVAEGFGLILQLSIHESMMMIAFIAGWIGLLLGWKWELYGGLLVICGVVVFYLLNYLFTNTLPGGPFFLIFAFPGPLFLYCGLQTRRELNSQNA